MKSLLDTSGMLLNSYSEIFFLRGRLMGLVLLLVTMLNPHVGIAGLFSVLSAYQFSRLIGMQQQFMQSGFFTYNALLVGLSIGYLFSLGALTLFLIAVAGVLSFVLSVMLNSIFSYYLKLPILSLPFVIVSSISWLASQGYGGLYVDGLYIHQAIIDITLPMWLEGFLSALGAILFSPQPLGGLIIAAVILIHSRILFGLAVAGYYLGALLSSLLAGYHVPVFTDINHFNYILIAMALGGVFLVPSPRSYLIAATGVAIATVLLSAVRLFWANYGIPVFTLPFNLVTLGFLYVMGTVGFPLVAKNIRRSPEETLDEYISHTRRFGEACCEISLPFSGDWTVWQGFDGQWTHRGQWQHAYDFVIQRNGKTHATDGQRLGDFYAWGKPVLSPCRGRVIKVVSNLPDNPPGHVNGQHNWGNLIILETMAGWYVEISHFAQHSIEVSEGQWLEPGAQIGLCGNSGYSAQPHIHIQVQTTAQVGAPTLPFRIRSYRLNNQFIPGGLPQEGDVVEPLYADRALEFRMAFPLDTELVYQSMHGDHGNDEFSLRVCMNDQGESYFDSGKGQLFFTNDDNSFYFYRLEGDDAQLALMFSALPRIPLVYRQHMSWQDSPPMAAVRHGWSRQLIDMIRAWNPQAGKSSYRAHWARQGLIHGVLSRGGRAKDELVEVILHDRLGFSELRVGEQRLILREAHT